MQSKWRVDVVDNDYQASYIALSKKMQKHRLTLRLEEFSVDDNDQTFGDNNNEYGKSATGNYTYRFNKPWFLAPCKNSASSLSSANWKGMFIIER